MVVSADVLERLEKLEELVKMIPALQKKVTGCHFHHHLHFLLHLHLTFSTPSICRRAAASSARRS